ncbi:MAG: chromate transporter [Limnohabitans sp.]
MPDPSPMTDLSSASPPPALARPHTHRELFIAFASMALQGFGGVLVVVQRELVERRRWLTREQFIEDWAVAQVMPGPNVINLGLMLGSRYFGLAGGLTAVAGLLLAPTLVVLSLAMLFGGVSDAPWAQGALKGMGAVAAGMIAGTAIKLGGALSQNPMGLVATLLALALGFAAVAWLRLPLVLVILGVGGPACLWAWIRLAPKKGTP